MAARKRDLAKEKAAQQRKAAKVAAMQPIVDGTSYPLPVFLKASGVGAHAVRQADIKARSEGMALVRELGGRKWILGKDWSALLEKAG